MMFMTFDRFWNIHPWWMDKAWASKAYTVVMSGHNMTEMKMCQKKSWYRYDGYRFGMCNR